MPSSEQQFSTVVDAVFTTSWSAPPTTYKDVSMLDKEGWIVGSQFICHASSPMHCNDAFMHADSPGRTLLFLLACRRFGAALEREERTIITSLKQPREATSELWEPAGQHTQTLSGFPPCSTRNQSCSASLQADRKRQVVIN